MGRTGEKDLIPSVMALIEASGEEGMTTGEIILALSHLYDFTEEDDQESNSQTGNYKWQQIVRNLRSNRTLERRGLARYENRKFYATKK